MHILVEFLNERDYKNTVRAYMRSQMSWLWVANIAKQKPTPILACMKELEKELRTETQFWKIRKQHEFITIKSYTVI